MKFRLALSVATFALVAAACGDASTAVATVNGEDLTADFMSSLRNSSGNSLNVNTEQFRQDLSLNIIRLATIQQAESEFGISVTDDEVAERVANPPLRWQSLFDELASDPDVSDVFVETQAELSIIRDRVTAELIRNEEGFIEETLAAAPQDVTAGCVRHILVGSQLEAEAVLSRLEAGEDFLAVADEVTLDSVSGSDLVSGCPIGFGGFVGPFGFAAATGPLNEAFGPVESEFGFHVLRVEQRLGPPTLEALTEEPLRFYPGVTLSGFFTPWFNDAVRVADITVAESVGRWSTAGVGIIPPGQ